MSPLLASRFLSLPLFLCSRHVSMDPKRDAAGHLRRCAKRSLECGLGCGHGAAHSVPEDEIIAHAHAA
jgi:hypothetical protein